MERHFAQKLVFTKGDGNRAHIYRLGSHFQVYLKDILCRIFLKNSVMTQKSNPSQSLLTHLKCVVVY